jgi:hypothetical protein
MGTPFGALYEQIQSAEQPTDAAGESGYFSAPSKTLDPTIFTPDERIRPEVKQFILGRFYDFMRSKGYQGAETWSRVWLAGSGASYQWSAGRGNGDLDVLIGIAHDRFYSSNPEYVGIPETTLDTMMNDQMKAELWPNTAHWNGYEVTFYVNPGATDIRNINPYAAIRVDTDEWTVRPPDLPSDYDPMSAFPKEYWGQVQQERTHAQTLVKTYQGLQADLNETQPGTPRWINLMAQIQHVIGEGADLFDDIHLGRKEAFSKSGKGYADYANFRWQAHKRDGSVIALHAMASMRAEARKATETAAYGAPIAPAQEALTAASLSAWRRAQGR